MKNFYKFLISKIKILISFLNNHKIDELSLDKRSKDIQYFSVPIINLDKITATDISENLLCSYEGDSNFASSNHYPVIESWIKFDKSSYSINDIFVYEQSKKLKKIRNKSIKTIKESVYLLPYYTSHFGHFSGDLIGQILFYINKIKNKSDNRKLLIITPSEKWDIFLKNFSNDKILLMSPKNALQFNYHFEDAKIFPRISNVQNFLLAKNILNEFIQDEPKLNKNIFITTDREDRISNINEVKEFLLKNNFEIIVPNKYEIIDLLRLIKSSSILISEKASVFNNVLLIRNKKYFLLSSESENNLDTRLFAGAGIYKEFNRGLFNEILFRDDPLIQNVKAYKKRIKVDINKLSSIITNNETY